MIFEPTVLRTTLMISSFSEDLVVGASPVVPLTTMPSWPVATKWAASVSIPAQSIAPSFVKGVTIAVRRRPNGAAVVISRTLPVLGGDSSRLFKGSVCKRH